MNEGAMSTEDLLDKCFHAVEALCAQQELVPERLEGSASGLLGLRLTGATRIWDLDIACNSTALTKLPSISLRQPRYLLAHVSYNGVICVNDGQGLSLDTERREDIVAYTVMAAYDLLEKWASDEIAGQAEFYNELEGYWLGLPDSCSSRAAMEVDGKDRLVSVYANTKAKPPKWYFTERNVPAPSEFFIKGMSSQRALYLHLNEPVAPPAYPAKLDVSFIEALHAKLSPSQLDLWAKLLGPSKNGPRRVALLVSVPRAAGGLSLIGMSLGARGGRIDSAVAVTPLTIRRHNITYMRERGGASMELYGKHVAVLGCGAVGSVVADALAASGVGQLTLVDHDNYSEDNIFRHVLDRMWIDTPKVIGLKFELERKYPGLKVMAIPNAAQDWFKQSNLKDLDGVVLAFGLPSLERSFGRALRQTEELLPVLFTWLEPLDLGGHSVLIWSKGEGCLDCLYRDDEGLAVLSPRTSFLMPNQSVSRNLTGCTSVHVPFGALQSRRTGILAAEHMLGALTGEIGPSYRFWVGEGKASAVQGLSSTPWWSTAPLISFAEASRRVFGRPCSRCRSAS